MLAHVAAVRVIVDLLRSLNLIDPLQPLERASVLPNLFCIEGGPYSNSLISSIILRLSDAKGSAQLNEPPLLEPRTPMSVNGITLLQLARYAEVVDGADTWSTTQLLPGGSPWGALARSGLPERRVDLLVQLVAGLFGSQLPAHTYVVPGDNFPDASQLDTYRLFARRFPALISINPADPWMIANDLQKRRDQFRLGDTNRKGSAS